MKRVVTGHKQGKSVIIEQDEPDHTVRAPGMVWRELWATYPDTKVPLSQNYKAEMKARWKSVFPGMGETRVRIVEFEPDKIEGLDGTTTAQIWTDQLPGLTEHMEPNNPGMHTTDSVDYGIVLAGRITLELDDGERVDLEAGDMVVQNGTRHAWRYTEKCTIAWILIGAPRDG